MFRGFRVGFFDYDRCLYPHEYPVIGNVHPSYYEECLLMLTQGMKRYERDKPLQCMQWAATIMKENGAVLYVLTHEIFSLRDEYKKKTALEDFGIENYLSVNTPEHKIDMMLAVAKMHNVNPRDCLFVDDKMELVYKACEAGICGKHISNIYSMYEQYMYCNVT